MTAYFQTLEWFSIKYINLFLFFVVLLTFSRTLHFNFFATNIILESPVIPTLNTRSPLLTKRNVRSNQRLTRPGVSLPLDFTTGKWHQLRASYDSKRLMEEARKFAAIHSQWTRIVRNVVRLTRANNVSVTTQRECTYIRCTAATLMSRFIGVALQRDSYRLSGVTGNLRKGRPRYHAKRLSRPACDKNADANRETSSHVPRARAVTAFFGTVR